MKNLYDASSLQNITGNSLDALFTKLLSLTKADFIHLAPENIFKFRNGDTINDMPQRIMDYLTLEGTPDQPMAQAIGPYEQLVHIPFKDGSRKVVLTLGFIRMPYDLQELEGEMQAYETHLSTALTQYKLESMEKERRFLQHFSSILSNVRTRSQLFWAINFHLRKYLGFRYATLFVLNADQDAAYDYLSGLDTEVGENPFHNDPLSALEFDEISETHDIKPYLDPHSLPGSITGIIINMYQGEMVIAHLVIAQESRHIKSQHQLPVIASMLLTILSKLKSEERSAERETEIDILQSLHVDFASIRDKDDLLKIIQYKLKKLLEFGHHWVAVINEDQVTMSCFLQEPMVGFKNTPQYRNMGSARYSTNDRVFNKAVLSKDPCVFDLEQLHSRSALPEYLSLFYENGVKKVVMIGLQAGNHVLGIWAISLAEGQELSPKQLNLMKSFSSQLSVAVDNIMANMAIKRREAEREKLLEFSFSLTSIRNRSHLIKVIKNNLKKVISFVDLVILINTESNPVNEVFLSTVDLPPNIETPENHLARNSYVDQVFQAEGMILYAEEKLTKDCNNGMICIGLMENEYRMCFFFLTNVPMANYAPHELELMKGVTYQLSPAIANILANEDIHRREKEKELLLAINMDIAAVRSQEELMEVIKQRLCDYIGFCHMSISTIEANVDDVLLSKVLQQTQPKLYDLKQLHSQQGLPDYFQTAYEEGATQVILVRLSKGMQVYGCWCLFFPENINLSTGQLELLEGIANQISIAMTNIQANEEIARKEQEKARLLSFSNAITSVRDKNILGKILKNQLKDLFQINDYVIHTLGDDKKYYTPILFDPEANFAQQPDFRKLINNLNPVKDGIFDRILASEDPIVVDLEQESTKPGHPDYLKSAKAVRIKRMIGSTIKLGQESIAMITFIHDDYDFILEQYHLFQSILAQVALTISNIIANEKVSKQLEEINRNKVHLEEEKIYLKEEIETTLNYGEIVGEGAGMQKTFRLISQVAPSDSTVLILGETGTGKELIARAIHNNSPRKNKLMVKVNCAALPANLIESELFGHERGSFTGATDRRLGKFELANNGTLFLDEIGEMPLDLQVKLLRALQEKEIERVGGNTTIKVNVRIIAATNRDLETEMQAGRFRGDLYYRLNIFPIELPALRNRKEDIPLLAKHFINRFAKKSGKDILTLGTRALQELVQYHWPGNIRELEHLIERSVLLAGGDTIKQVHLPAVKPQTIIKEEEDFVIQSYDAHERDIILKTLKYCSGRIAGKDGAALLLGLPTSTLNSKIKRLGIRKEHLPR